MMLLRVIMAVIAALIAADWSVSAAAELDQRGQRSVQQGPSC